MCIRDSSFTHKVSTTELIDYLETNKENFINFKSHHLIGDKTNDPIKKADAIRNILFSLSHISDPLIQAEYLVYISKNFDIDEFTLREEFQRILRDRLKKQLQNTYNYNPITDKPKKKLKNQKNLSSINNKINQQEKRILYILIPVSYTHLDVYKRQLDNVCQQLENIPDHPNNLWLRWAAPVSYTHLY